MVYTRPRFTLTAGKEVVLSAGSIGTPNILLHSGIGNSSTLTSLGIKPLHNLSSVGQNLLDHPLLSLSFLVNSNDTYETARRNATLAAEQFAEWNATRSSPLVDNPSSHQAWLRIPGNPSIFERFADPAAGPNTAHYGIIVSNGMLPLGPPPPTGNFLRLGLSVASPTARGAVTLSSSDPLVASLIDLNPMGAELDFLIMREAIRSAFRFTSAPAWADYVFSPVALNSTSTDSQLDAYIRTNTGHVSRGAEWGIVDPDLRVKGLSGLRVVDLSIVPFLPTAQTQAAAYIIAERAADLIKGTWNY
ncbi:hypothetical protein FB451DRAFT_1121423 [Mycena latifolia]|nr:hypothetical protein FB451DRAFT_1121423 [Mycena latifolia]